MDASEIGSPMASKKREWYYTATGITFSNPLEVAQ
jgi:hypothetical protein